MHLSPVAILGALLLGLSLVGCSSAGSNLPLLDQSPVSQASYLLGAGDQLRVTVYGSEDLSGEVPVDDTGMAVLPLIGPIKAAGATPRQLEEVLRTKLIGDEYLKNPDVTVQIIHFRPIYVLGEVQKPGDHPYVPGMTVRAAIALAGGFTPRANQNFVIVTRQRAQGRMNQLAAHPQPRCLFPEFLSVTHGEPINTGIGSENSPCVVNTG
jgi:protein involved in polysaccharide export with SLBB domain